MHGGGSNVGVTCTNPDLPIHMVCKVHSKPRLIWWNDLFLSVDHLLLRDREAIMWQNLPLLRLSCEKSQHSTIDQSWVQPMLLHWDWMQHTWMCNSRAQGLKWNKVLVLVTAKIGSNICSQCLEAGTGRVSSEWRGQQRCSALSSPLPFTGTIRPWWILQTKENI